MGGRKEFLRNAGLGGLGGLARDFNDSRTRIYFLAKAQRTQRIPTECRTWRLDERWFTQIFCSRKGKEDAKEFLRNVGLGGLGGLARDINDPRTRIYILAKARRTQRNSYGMLDLADLAAWREFLMIHARGLFSRKGAKDAKDSNWIIDLARKITKLT